MSGTDMADDVLLVQAFDAHHRALAVTDGGCGDPIAFETGDHALRVMVRFMHDTRRGQLDDAGAPRLIAYWKVGLPGSHGRIYLTRYGRSLPVAMSRIPRYTGPAPEMLPEPAAPYQKCKPGCDCNRHQARTRKDAA